MIFSPKSPDPNPLGFWCSVLNLTASQQTLSRQGNEFRVEPPSDVALCQEHVGTSHIQLVRAECGMETRKQQMKFANCSRSPRTSNTSVSSDAFRRYGDESCHRAPASSALAASPGWRRRESYSTAPSGSPPTLDKNDRSFIEVTCPTGRDADEWGETDQRGHFHIYACASRWLMKVFASLQYPSMLFPVKY